VRPRDGIPEAALHFQAINRAARFEFRRSGLPGNPSNLPPGTFWCSICRMPVRSFSSVNDQRCPGEADVGDTFLGLRAGSRS
jgi:hypothetical protein